MPTRLPWIFRLDKNNDSLLGLGLGMSWFIELGVPIPPILPMSQSTSLALMPERFHYRNCNEIKIAFVGTLNHP